MNWAIRNMAPKKLSKREKKKLQKEKAQKAAKVRGVGVGSRQKFALAAKWREEPYRSSDRERGVRKRVSYVSPGKTKYWWQKCVEKELVSRNLKDCLYEKSASSTEDNSDGDDEDYCEEERAVKKRKLQSSDELAESSDENKGCLEIERRLFVCESTQIMDMVEQINATSQCSTPECSGG